MSLDATASTCPAHSEAGLRCIRPAFDHGDEPPYHAGGHVFADGRAQDLLARGHFDAGALLQGATTEAHLPEQCPGSECAMGRAVAAQAELARESILSENAYLNYPQYRERYEKWGCDAMGLMAEDLADAEAEVAWLRAKLLELDGATLHELEP